MKLEDLKKYDVVYYATGAGNIEACTVEIEDNFIYLKKDVYLIPIKEKGKVKYSCGSYDFDDIFSSLEEAKNYIERRADNYIEKYFGSDKELVEKLFQSYSVSMSRSSSELVDMILNKLKSKIENMFKGD